MHTTIVVAVRTHILKYSLNNILYVSVDMNAIIECYVATAQNRNGKIKINSWCRSLLLPSPSIFRSFSPPCLLSSYPKIVVNISE